MKKIISICALCIISSALKAQKVYVVPNDKPQYSVKNYYFSLPDTTATHKMLSHQLQQQLIDNMTVGNVPAIHLTYKFNNGKGLDIYQANIDNMYVLKPDSTFYSSMPVDNKATNEISVPKIK